MKQCGPSGIPWLSRWILIGTVMIGWPSEIPANRLKFDGVPADSTVAVTSPPRTATGSAMSAPPAGATTEKTPLVLSSTSPTWRLVFPVGVVREPIVMPPCVELDATQKLLEPVPPPPKLRLPPVAASIAGSSTGQRVNGPQSPGGVVNVVSAPVVLPAELVAITWKWKTTFGVASPVATALAAWYVKLEPRSPGVHGTVVALLYPVPMKLPSSPTWNG